MSNDSVILQQESILLGKLNLACLHFKIKSNFYEVGFWERKPNFKNTNEKKLIQVKLNQFIKNETTLCPYLETLLIYFTHERDSLLS